MNKELIKKLSNGEIALKYDRYYDSLEDLQKVLKEAFPKDDFEEDGGFDFYYADGGGGDGQYSRNMVLVNFAPKNIYKLSDFLKPALEETFVEGEIVEVSSTGNTWSKRIYVTTLPKNVKNRFVTVHNCYEKEYANKEKYEVICWKQIRKVKKEYKITFNGKEVSPKDLTEEDWSELKNS